MTHRTRTAFTCLLIWILFAMMPAIGAEPTLRVQAGGAEICTVAGDQVSSHEGIFPVAIAAELGSTVIKSGLSALGKYFASAASSTSSSLMTATTMADMYQFDKVGEIYRAKLGIECIRLAVGVVGRIDPQRLPEWLLSDERQKAVDPDQIFVKKTSGPADVSVLQRLGLLDYPTAYFELRVEKHSGADALRLIPLVAYFRESSSARNKLGAKNIEITVTFARPTSTGSLDPQNAANGVVAQFPLVINELTPGLVRKTGISNFETVWIAAPDQPSSASIDAATRFNKDSGQEPPTIDPTNIFISYRETDQPELMYQVMASFLTDNSDQINKSSVEIIKELLSSDRQKK